MAIEIQGEMYDFKFTPVRVEMIEQAIGKSIVGAFHQAQGMIQLTDLKIIFIKSLKKEDGGYIPTSVGEKAFYTIIEEIGYAPMIVMIEEALERDCPFLFQGA